MTSCVSQCRGRRQRVHPRRAPSAWKLSRTPPWRRIRQYLLIFGGLATWYLRCLSREASSASIFCEGGFLERSLRRLPVILGFGISSCCRSQLAFWEQPWAWRRCTAHAWIATAAVCWLPAILERESPRSPLRWRGAASRLFLMIG